MSARPRLRSRLAAAAALPLLLAGVLAPAAAAAEPDEYVALGDSYASGNGTQWPDLSLSCYRSSLAYAPIVARERPNTTLRFRACSGAETQDVIDGQNAALSASTDVVTVSVGGNDVGFVDLILSCFSTWDEPLCRSTVSRVDRRIDSDLPARLDATYADIRARAPEAKVIVVGYPQPFGADVSCGQARGINEREAAALDGVAAHLDRVLAERAAAAGFTYLDPGDAFTGHDVCSTDPYVWGKRTGVLDIYHPTRAGHRDGFAPLVATAMG
ncbi:SGNH/GDSL hydrolase family protein [Phycicoccus endophyticus]|uniref:SGNH/GDSL hydrolase family protein n=1 Tax=Phycicoccus endophyticus TaxID=1690220 RepID=A0A7G9QZ23_9MICO|nr:SGNH/GDSL hydrolase family protein [Phycicoccus endophyticus]NHI18939.1 SGNH/GDSL hydrolase family protein [Phycicoccus endophyticus]QNN48598.1 SGNH/GDSL hydrolase family protein [Phycicoccus endophyticus]GGL31555.1 lipase 1 [Phycicoccus endophyticus]